MFRILAAVFLFRLLSQAGGFDLVGESGETPCEESQGGDCSPGCEDCLCCPHQRAMTLTAATDAVLAGAGSPEFAAVPAPAQDPRVEEILHIPKTGFVV